MTMHPGEVSVGDEVAAALIGAQFPQWRGLPVRRTAARLLADGTAC